MILSDNDLRLYISRGLLKIEPLSNDTVRENGVDLKLAEYEICDGYALGLTVEYITVPRNLVGFCNLRSTLARMGLFIPPTIIDAGFEGKIVVEILGRIDLLDLVVGKRFLHVVFAETKSPSTGYRGQYQGQRDIIIGEI